MGCFQPKLVSEEPKTSSTGTGPVGLWKTNQSVDVNIASPGRRAIQERNRRAVSAENVDGVIHVYYTADAETDMSPLGDSAPSYIPDDVVLSPSMVKAAGTRLHTAADTATDAINDKLLKPAGRNLGRELAIPHTVDARDVFSRDGLGLAGRVAMPLVLSPEKAVLGEMLWSSVFPPYGDPDFKSWMGRPMRTEAENPASYVRKELGGARDGAKVELMVHPSLAAATFPSAASLPYAFPGDWVTPMDRAGPIRGEVVGKSWHLPAHVASSRLAGLHYPTALYSGEISKPGKTRGTTPKLHALKKGVASRVGMDYHTAASPAEEDLYTVLPEPSWGYDPMWHGESPVWGKGYAADMSTEEEFAALRGGDTTPEKDEIKPEAFQESKLADPKAQTAGGSKLLQLARRVYSECISSTKKGVVGGTPTAIVYNFLCTLKDVGFTTNINAVQTSRSLVLSGFPYIVTSLPGPSAYNSGDGTGNLVHNVVPRINPGADLEWAESAQSFANLLAGTADSSVIRNLRVNDPAFSGAGYLQMVQRLWFDVDSGSGTCSSGVLIPLLFALLKFLPFSGEAMGQPFVGGTPLSAQYNQANVTSYFGRKCTPAQWNAAAFALPTRVCTMDVYFQLAGNTAIADNGWGPETWGATTQVIPIRREQTSLSGTSTFAWSCGFLPHPMWQSATPVTSPNVAANGSAVNASDFVNLPCIGTSTGVQILYVLCDQWSGATVRSSITVGPAGNNATVNCIQNNPVANYLGVQQASVNMAGPAQATVAAWVNNNTQGMLDFQQSVSTWGRWLGTRAEEQVALSAVANFNWVYTQQTACYADWQNNGIILTETFPYSVAGLNEYLGQVSSALAQPASTGNGSRISLTVPWFSPTPMIARMSGSLHPSRVGSSFESPHLCLPGVRPGDVLANTYWRSLSMACYSDLAFQALGIKATHVYAGLSLTLPNSSSELNTIQTVQQMIIGQVAPNCFGTGLHTTSNNTGTTWQNSFFYTRNTSSVARTQLFWLGSWTGDWTWANQSAMWSYTGGMVAEYRMLNPVGGAPAAATWLDRLSSVGQESFGEQDSWYNLTSFVSRATSAYLVGKSNFNNGIIVGFHCCRINAASTWNAEMTNNMTLPGWPMSSGDNQWCIPSLPSLMDDNGNLMKILLMNFRQASTGRMICKGTWISDETGPSPAVPNVDPSAISDVQASLAALFR